MLQLAAGFFVAFLVIAVVAVILGWLFYMRDEENVLEGWGFILLPSGILGPTLLGGLIAYFRTCKSDEWECGLQSIAGLSIIPLVISVIVLVAGLFAGNRFNTLACNRFGVGALQATWLGPVLVALSVATWDAFVL